MAARRKAAPKKESAAKRERDEKAGGRKANAKLREERKDGKEKRR
jgi:hypothetical protein